MIVVGGLVALDFLAGLFRLGPSASGVVEVLAVVVARLAVLACFVEALLMARREHFPTVVSGRRWLAVRTGRRWRSVNLESVTDAGVNGDVIWLTDTDQQVRLSVGATARNHALLKSVIAAGARADSQDVQAQAWRLSRPGPIQRP